MPRKPVRMTAEGLAQSCKIVHGPQASLPVIQAIMPPGGYGSARVLPVTADSRSNSECIHDIGQRIHVLQVTNGAWLRPRWLEFRVNPSPERDQTSHKLEGSFEVDVATTGGYTLAGYWNECWDEGQSLGWEEATIRYPDGDLNALTSIPVQEKDGGYGYGSEAVVLLTPKDGTPTPAELPVLGSVITNHTIKRLEIRSRGNGWTKQLGIRVLRQPPLFRVATAEVKRDRGVTGPLGEIRITDAGGWYTRPPYVVISDRAGNGYGARATAILNGCGGVARVQINDPGWCYSDDVVILFYTHQWVQSERPILLQSPTEVKLEDVWHPFGDAKSRSVDYYLTLMPRHAQYLEAASTQNSGATDPRLVVRTMVPRDSIAASLDIKATARPSPPNIAYPLLSFHWTYDDGGREAIDDPRNYFRGLKTGTLTLTRTEAIRVYIRRPWNQSGAETLVVVVYPAIANSARVAGDLNPADGGVVNRSSDYPNEVGRRNALTGDVIPKPFRDIVFALGFRSNLERTGAATARAPAFPARHRRSGVRNAERRNRGRREHWRGWRLHEVHYDSCQESLVRRCGRKHAGPWPADRRPPLYSPEPGLAPETRSSGAPVVGDRRHGSDSHFRQTFATGDPIARWAIRVRALRQLRAEPTEGDGLSAPPRHRRIATSRPVITGRCRTPSQAKPTLRQRPARNPGDDARVVEGRPNISRPAQAAGGYDRQASRRTIDCEREYQQSGEKAGCALRNRSQRGRILQNPLAPAVGHWGAHGHVQQRGLRRSHFDVYDLFALAEVSIDSRYRFRI